MTQEIQVTITLEVDVIRTKEDIKASIEYNLSQMTFDKLISVVSVDSIKEEAEIYGNE
jgi:hypothetical protein